MPPKKNKPTKDSEKKPKAEGKWPYSLAHYTNENFRALFSLKKGGKDDQPNTDQGGSDKGIENYNQVFYIMFYIIFLYSSLPKC